MTTVQRQLRAGRTESRAARTCVVYLPYRPTDVSGSLNSRSGNRQTRMAWRFNGASSFYVTLMFAAGLASGSKILLIPAPLHSHCLEVCFIGQELLRRGHEVVAYVISNFDTTECPQGMGIRVIQYKYVLGLEKLREFQDRYSQMVLGNHTGAADSFQLLSDAQNNTCWPILADQHGFAQLEREKFDFVIADGFYTFACYLLIPYKLKIPYAVVSSLILDYPSVRPFLPNIKPHPFTDFTDEMTFMQRLTNTIVTLTPYYMGMYLMPMEIISRFAPEMSAREVMELVSKSEIFLENNDPVLGYPQPLMPNIIQVGGISAEPSKPLPKSLQTHFNATKEVVVVSFGSAFELPPEIIKKFMDTFKLLDISVVWKTVDEGKEGNVLKTKWMPQNDVLGHPKTKLLIYHCGNNGLYEALYHAVPIICIPLLVDHKFNAQRIKKWEVGKVLDIQNFTPEELASDVRKVLTNPIYLRNMKRVSEMFLDKMGSPRERGAFWVEHVIKYGGNHLRSHGTNMPFYQFLLLDIYLFIIVILLFVSFVLYKLVSLCVRLCNRLRKLKEKED